MIDAHVHFWNYHPVKDAWISDEMKDIKRDFSPTDFLQATSLHAVKGCVAVQADQSTLETDFLCGLATKNPIIKGVVGWVDLLADDLESQLEKYQQNPIIKGFRHIAQGEADDFLSRKEIIQGIQTLHPYGFTYDILVYHKQLPAVITLVENLPKAQKLIIDHGAKPNIAAQEWQSWAAQIQQIAQHPNVYCKVSGLLTEALHNQWKSEDFFLYLKVIFEAFGTDRLVFGSDWPVINLSGNFDVWINILEQFFRKNKIQISNDFWQGNAEGFYNL